MFDRFKNFILPALRDINSKIFKGNHVYFSLTASIQDTLSTEMCKVYRPQGGSWGIFQKICLGGLGGIRIFDDAMQKIGFLP